MVLLRLEVDSDLRTDGLRYSETFGRRIRQDPPAQLGVPTMDLAILALRRGARDDARELCQYMADEFKIVYDTLLNRWLHQIFEYTLPLLGAEKLETALRVPRKHAWDAFFAVGKGFLDEAIEPIGAGDVGHTA